MIRFNFIGPWSQALIGDKRRGGRWSVPRAVCTTLLLIAFGGSGLLTGCGGLAATSQEVPATGPDLAFREVIAGHLKKTFKNYSSYDGFEISDPRWVHSLKGWYWLTCVRFRDRGHLRTYVVFFEGNKVVDDRYAVQIDACDTQTYAPFDHMQGGLEPLH